MKKSEQAYIEHIVRKIVKECLKELGLFAMSGKQQIWSHILRQYRNFFRD